MNTLVTLVKGCFMGFLFIMFLPAIGFVLTGKALFDLARKRLVG